MTLLVAVKVFMGLETTSITFVATFAFIHSVYLSLLRSSLLPYILADHIFDKPI
jgi:hypothetical protein